MNGLGFERILALLYLFVLGAVSKKKKALGVSIKPWKKDGAVFLR